MIIRAAGVADKAWLFDLHQRLYQEHIEQIWGWDTVDQLTIFEREWEECATRMVEINETPAGCVQLKTVEGRMFLLNLALDLPFQSQGYGSSLMNQLKQEASDLNMPIRLNVFRTNPRAKAFYLRHEFGSVKEGENGEQMEWCPPALKQ